MRIGNTAASWEPHKRSIRHSSFQGAIFATTLSCMPWHGVRSRTDIGEMKCVLSSLLRVSNHTLASEPLAKRLLRNAVVVFLYHDVSDHPSEFNRMFHLNVPPQVFAQQLDLIGQHFHFITPDQLLAGDYRTPAALITFDDRNAGVVHEALPILKAKGVSAVLFVNMGPSRGELCWAGLVAFLQYCEPQFSARAVRQPYDFVHFTESEITQYLETIDTQDLFERVRAFRGTVADEADLQTLSTEPLLFLGSHLYNHYNARTLSPQRLRTEYWKNQQFLDAHPRGVRLFSYPFGQPQTCHDEQTTALLAEEGARAVFSAYALPNFSREAILYHRVPMFEDVRSVGELYRVILFNYLRARIGLAPVALA